MLVNISLASALIASNHFKGLQLIGKSISHTYQLNLVNHTINNILLKLGTYMRIIQCLHYHGSVFGKKSDERKLSYPNYKIFCTPLSINLCRLIKSLYLWMVSVNFLHQTPKKWRYFQ